MEVITRPDNLARVQPLLNSDRPNRRPTQIEDRRHAVSEEQLTHVPVVMNVRIDKSRDDELPAGFDDLSSCWNRRRSCISRPHARNCAVRNETSSTATR